MKKKTLLNKLYIIYTFQTVYKTLTNLDDEIDIEYEHKFVDKIKTYDIQDEKKNVKVYYKNNIEKSMDITFKQNLNIFTVSLNIMLNLFF